MMRFSSGLRNESTGAGGADDGNKNDSVHIHKTLSVRFSMEKNGVFKTIVKDRHIQDLIILCPVYRPFYMKGFAMLAYL